MKRIGAVVLAVVVALGGAVVAAPAADAGVPYSWWCYKSGRASVHVWTPGGVGYWQGRMGYRCVGGFWVYV